MRLKKKGQMITSWLVAIFLFIYCVFSNYLLISYAGEYQTEYNSQNITINQTTNYNSSSIVTQETSTISFFYSLFLVSFVELPFFVSVIFIYLPDILLIVLAYNLIRGNW